MENKTTVFLGGTVGTPASNWREELISLLNDSVDPFNPVVDDWNEEAQAAEEYARENSDIIVYTITPETDGLFTIHEVTADSFIRPEKTVVCVMSLYNGHTFDNHQTKAWKKIVKNVELNGVRVARDLEELVTILNNIN